MPVERPTYTARRREALVVVRNPDGSLEIGKGRVKIAPGTVPYFRRVVAALNYAIDLPGGQEALDHGDALGHAVTITQPKLATIPANAWTLPDGHVVFDADDWPRPGDPQSRTRHEILLNLLEQANRYAAGQPAPPAPAGIISAAQGPLRLTCHPLKAGDALSFPYVVENTGAADVFVMTAMASATPDTREACVKQRLAVQIGPDGDAIAGLFLPPLPADRTMAAPIVALARRLAPGKSLEQRLEIPAPYAETSCWLPDLPPDPKTTTPVKGVVLAISYWTTDNVAQEAAYAPGLYPIAAATGGSVVSLRFPTTGLQFCRRSAG